MSQRICTVFLRTVLRRSTNTQYGTFTSVRATDFDCQLKTAKEKFTRDFVRKVRPCTHIGVKYYRRYVRASHGLAGVMQSFSKKFRIVKPARFFVVSRFVFCQQILSAEFYCQQIFFVSRFCQQNSIVSRFFFVSRFLQSAVSTFVRRMSHAPTNGISTLIA